MKTSCRLKAKHGRIIMLKSTERALRWWLMERLKEEIFALEARLARRNTMAIHESELEKYEKAKMLLRALEEELDKN